MEKNQLVELTIKDQSQDGRGIASCDGLIVFAEGCVVGDRVSARLTKIKKRYALARVEEFLESSEYRLDDVCPYIDECGGCSFGKLKYEKQLELKERHVRDVLERIGGIESPELEPIISMSEPYFYRNKARLAIYPKTRSVGFLGRMSHKVIDCHECRLQSEPVVAVADALRDSFDECEDAKKIKNLVVKTSFTSGEVMVVPTVEEKDVDLESFIYTVDDRINAIPGFDDGFEYYLSSVALDVSDNKPSKQHLNRAEIIAGRHVIEDEMLGLRFEISPYSFYQVNPVQAEHLYEKAVEYAGIKGGETVLDLYCGVGTIGLFMARAGAGKVIGIELVKEAVLNANRNAVINGIVNAIYYTGKAEEELPKLREEGKIEKADVVILDPPRKGCDEVLLKAVVDTEADRIVYISCNPATMSRDIKYLVEKGYEYVKGTPVDMFPHTGHVECIALIQRVKS
ncbi:23S rRNA (uracil-C(5))-methyltransferase RlmCD [[Eubacterium] infirmum]|nr:23S rRNA (uracil-C(5))-methyltransferase RlmCD [[Eubacterium] infirmum]